jgi:hypothetical protein
MSDTDSVARLGRAVAVPIVAATQRPTQKAMGQGAVRSQMDTRICFRVRERKDVDLVLGQGMLSAGWHAHALNAPGKFLVSAPEHTTPKRARAYLVTDDDVARVTAQSTPTSSSRPRRCTRPKAQPTNAGRAPRLAGTHCAASCGAAICDRKMQGTWNNGKPHYRCTFLNQYAAKNRVDHPKSVYLREELLLAKLDKWLARKLDPVAFRAAIREYQAIQPGPQPDEDARQEIADCDARLRQHRAALEAGADPVIVTGWMKGPGQAHSRQSAAQQTESNSTTPDRGRNHESRPKRRQHHAGAKARGPSRQSRPLQPPASHAEVLSKRKAGRGRSPTRFGHVRRSVSEE